MSDIRINTCPPETTSQSSSATKKRKWKSKWCRNKRRFLGKTDSWKFKGKQQHGQAGNDETQVQNGESTNHSASPTSSQHQTLLPLSSASDGGSKPSASTHRELPSSTLTVTNDKMPSTEPTSSVSSSCKPATSTTVGNPTKYLAIDCEMVGAGPKGSINLLARCSIVSYEGDVVYDKFISPSMPVTDYRTRWSGIRPHNLLKATPFSQARKEILKLLVGKVVIGHAIHNDFKSLSYSHPAALVRDTSRIPLLNRKAGFAETECASLKRLTKAIFNRDIQTGRKGHSSVEDAKATMELYKVVEEEWERTLAARSKAT